MRFSKLYLKTLKESPKEAEVISHQLLLRAGMIKKLASGIYSYLPLGKITLNKIEKIIREELDNAGCQEILMPVLQPAELWQESGRWLKMGEEMMRMQDRHNRDFVLGPTHEEVITDIIRNDIKSYKDLPLNLYQIQTKFRDERRPRFGLMRGREFLMKDAYSFHTSEEDLDREYHNMYKAYERIFSRCGLNFRPVEADSGAIGGSHTHEFHVLAESGEDDILYCNKCDYAANSEKAISNIDLTENTEDEKELTLVDTENRSSIEDVAKFLNVDITKTVKAMMFKSVLENETKYYMALIRGDYEVNEVKLKNAVNSPVDLELITDEEFEKLNITKGYCGALKNISEDIYVVADETIKPMKNMVIGANIKDKHYINANIERDIKIDKFYDIRMIKVGESCPHCDGTLEIARGIEVGQVFKLGTGYAEALGAKYLDENGKLQVMTMGCYGIGVSRTMAAAIEQNYDEYGIVWPVSIAPFVVNIIPANMKIKLRKTAETIEVNADEAINKVRELIKNL
ncbi:MAG: prolyl-tRNA synthetase [Fusobacteriales bacterium]|nr:prolyl-tRNA synthetase [Fusobacteriales bacterium]